MFDIFDLGFTIIFTLEMIIKLIGLGLRQYVNDGWNKFDCVVVLGAWVNFYVKAHFSDLNVDFTMLRIIRLFRVSRLIR